LSVVSCQLAVGSWQLAVAKQIEVSAAQRWPSPDPTTPP
jgi:hypothetical protein